MRDAIRDRLRALAGPQALLPPERFRVLGIEPAAAVAPGSVEHVAAIMAEASAAGWAVEPAGAGTALDAGRRPGRVDVVLSTTRLTAVTEYVPADLTIGVQAGMGVDDLDERLAAERQWLPLDPPAAPGATLGAIFAAGTAGPLETGFGRPRDAALGVQLVTGDGRVLELGGRVVKNVAGYDLVRLAVGSHGTLGIITRLHLRLQPRPSADTTLAFHGDEPRALLHRARVAGRIGAIAVELLSPAAAAEVTGTAAGWLLLVRFAGPPDTVAAAVRASDPDARDSGHNPLSDQALRSCWQRLARSEAAADLRIRLSDLPSREASTLESAISAIAAAGAEKDGRTRSDNVLGDWAVAVHATRGVVRLWRRDAPGERVVRTVVDAARRALAAGGGRVSVTRMAQSVAGSVEPFGEPEGLDLMRGLKRVFDPAGVLSPGRWVL